MEMYTVSQWVMFFYIYCFFGWVWESCYVSVKSKKLVNRGFLKGPFLPIYGSGALCVLIVTIPVRGNIPLMFVTGMVAATLLEYVTGAVMERLFRVRYWDYTGKFLNINGYICLGSTICWGVMTILIVDVVHQYIEQLVFAVDETYITILVLIITPVITADFVTSFHAAIHLRDVLIQNERIKEELQKLSEKKSELEQRLKDSSEKAVEQAKEQAVLAMEQAIQVKDQAKEQAALAREQAAQEMQELLLKMGELKGKLSIPYGKSIRGLLKRNPAAVSRTHKDSFAELKQNLMERIVRK
ncbi:MAG: hypothetical protein Q4C61_14240 [Lachnospiraceae bacterium]|nr:hypothetical protein [Lachnospiraceae bacterium]